MPTVLYKQGYRFFFYSNENQEPPHIHVEKDDAYGKLWLEPNIREAYFRNFSSREIRLIVAICKGNHDLFKTKWNEYFGKQV